nr:MAG TPA: hypothetical protein [Caudoviricetes sp.]
MLMCLGMFVFAVQSAPIDSIQRATQWRWPANNRTGGEPYLLMHGTGAVMGYWLIDSLNETSSVLMPDGQALKIEFTLSLKRYDGRHTPFGRLSPLLQLITRLF